MRRIVYVASFEVLAITCATILLTLLSGTKASTSLPVSVTISVVALLWNYIYNLMFETWEKRSGRTTRTVLLRIGHTVGFECGLVVAIIPIYMFAFSTGAAAAFKMQIAIMIFFLFYTFFFTWAFDKLFARTL